MIFIYKELIKKYLNLLTVEHIKNFALSKNECLTQKEATIIYDHIMTHHEELLNKNTNSFKSLKPNLRNDLFEKIQLLYNEYAQKYL